MFGFNMGFSDPATPIMEGIIDLHNYIFFYLILILVMLLWFFLSFTFQFWIRLRFPRTMVDVWTHRNDMYRFRKFSHSSQLEVVWTITPSIILLFIAIPSFALLYAMDEVINPAVTLKAIGHQWYWSYEYSDYASYKDRNILQQISFDSNLVFESDLKLGEHRLLQVDNPIVLPVDVHLRVIITSFDVIHSWAVPSFGIKCDAVPGRLNQASLFIKREGVFYGQCSELCGVNHGFMPIVVKAVSMDEYKLFIQHSLQK
jgi:cytochrome c oxidase subunit 2